MAFDQKVMAEHKRKMEDTKKRDLPEGKFQIDDDSDEEVKEPTQVSVVKSPVQGEVMSSSSDEEEEQTAG